jgi:hypothetical protein
VPASSTPQEVLARRNWPRLAFGAVVVLVSGLAFTGLYRSAGDRKPVLALARDVQRYQEIQPGDLRSVLVAAEPGVELVPEADLDEVVGHMALTSLPQGSLLSPGDVAGKDDHLVGPGEALVGAKLAEGAAPLGDIPAGTRVLVIVRPGSASQDGEVREVPGWVAALGRPGANGTRDASLAVPQTSAGDVAAAAAEERVAVVSLEGG